jgi:hypothetical protein
VRVRALPALPLYYTLNHRPAGKFTDQYKATIGVDFIYQKYRILKQDFTLHMYASPPQRCSHSYDSWECHARRELRAA